MEALGAAANIIAVADAGLKLAQTIYRIIYSMKDALRNCNRVLQSLSNLASVLQQIHGLESGKQHNDSLHIVEGMKWHMEACMQDLNMIQQRIAKLRPDPSYTLLQRTVKKLKTALNEDDIVDFERRIDSHFQNLQSHLILAGIKVDISISDQMLEVTSIVEQSHQQTQIQIASAEFAIIQASDNNMKSLKAQVVNLGQRVDDKLNILNTNVTEIRTQMRKNERAGSDNALMAFGEICGLVAPSYTRNEANLPAVQVRKIMRELGNFVNHAAEGSFEDLGSQSDITGNAYRAGKKKPSIEQASSAQRSRWLSRIIDNVQGVLIGRNVSSNVKDSLANPKDLAPVERNTFRLHQEETTLEVAQLVRRSRNGGIYGTTESYTRFSMFKEVDGYGTVADLEILQRNQDVSASLSFRAIIPFECEMMEALRNCDLPRVSSIIERGGGSVNDCSPDGDSLLMIAIYLRDIPTAKYLISKGADVNYVRSGSSALWAASHDQDDDRRKEMLETLLSRDFDPTAQASVLKYYIQIMEQDDWWKFIDSVACFYDINDRLKWDTSDRFPSTILQSIVSGETGGLIPFIKQLEKDLPIVVENLLKHGADPTVTDQQDRNCLHLVLTELIKKTNDSLRVRQVYEAVEKSKELLQVMISCGKFDLRGKSVGYGSVSDCAFNAKIGASRGSTKLSQCIWPIWVEMLEGEGLDVLEIAAGSKHYAEIEILKLCGGYCPCGNCEPLQPPPSLKSSAKKVLTYDEIRKDPLLLQKRIESSDDYARRSIFREFEQLRAYDTEHTQIGPRPPSVF